MTNVEDDERQPALHVFCGSLVFRSLSLSGTALASQPWSLCLPNFILRWFSDSITCTDPIRSNHSDCSPNSFEIPSASPTNDPFRDQRSPCVAKQLFCSSDFSMSGNNFASQWMPGFTPFTRHIDAARAISRLRTRYSETTQRVSINRCDRSARPGWS